MLSSSSSATTPVRLAVVALGMIAAASTFFHAPSRFNFFGIGASMAARKIYGQPQEMRVRLVAHGIPNYDAWLAANGPYFKPGAPAAYPPEAGMFATREVFFLSPAKDQIFYILFFGAKGEPVIRAAFAPDSEAWKMGEKAGFLLQPVSVRHMDASALFGDSFAGGEAVLPAPGEAFVQPDSWPAGFPSIDKSTLMFDCPVNVETGKYECRS